MDKKELGEELHSMLINDYNIVKISRWAQRIYSNNIKTLDKSVLEILECLMSMEDDPQFEYSCEELDSIASRLINEDESDRLNNAQLENLKMAASIDDHWLLCPDCIDAWETTSHEPKIICPKCNRIFQNPRSNFSK